MSEFVIVPWVKNLQEEIATMEDIAIKDFGTVLKYILGLFYCLSVFDDISNDLKKKFLLQ